MYIHACMFKLTDSLKHWDLDTVNKYVDLFGTTVNKESISLSFDILALFCLFLNQKRQCVNKQNEG